MSEAQDYYDQLVNSYNYSAWDPKTKKNVYTPEGAHAYVQNNAANYKGYTGRVNTTNTAAIHPETYGVDTGTRTAPKFSQDYRTAHERSSLNPYDAGATAELGNYQKQAVNQARVAPGVRPNIGFLPDRNGGYDMRSFRPLDWDLLDAGIGRTGKLRTSPNLFEQDFTRELSKRNFKAPTYMELQAKAGRPGELPNFGRGFEYRGSPSAEEQQMIADLQAGKPVDWNRFDKIRKARIHQIELSALQKGANKYAFPVIGGIMTAATGGLAGPIYGAGMGAMTAGTMTKWKEPLPVLLGAGGGALAGWGAGQIPGVSSLPGAAQGAVTGAASGVGSSVARGAGTGEFNPEDILRGAVIGGAGGAAVGSLPGGPPNVPGGRPTPNPYGPFVRAGTGVAGDLVWPRNDRRRRRPRNPYEDNNLPGNG